MSEYELSAHARTVLAERSIPEEWLARVLQQPDRREQDREDPEVTHALGSIPEHGGRVLQVVYNASAKPVRVVTVFFDRTQRGKR